MERGILRTFKADGTPVEIYDAKALTKAEFTAFNTYSTNEVDTGEKWIDGRTIYQKVIDCGAGPNSATGSTSKQVPHNIQNYYKCISISGNRYDTALNQTLSLNGDEAIQYLAVRGDNILIAGNSPHNLTSQQLIIILKYIKTE